MSVKFWLARASKVFAMVAILLFIVELLKGHLLQDAITFALLWSVMSTAVYVAASIYQLRKGKACPLCVEQPEAQDKQH